MSLRLTLKVWEMPGGRTGLRARSYSATEAAEDQRVQRTRECRGRNGERSGRLRLGASLPRVHGQCEAQNWRGKGI